MENTNTLDILKRLERGEINIAEASARLNEPPPVERNYDPHPQVGDVLGWIRRLWIYPLASGIVGVCIGAWVIAATYRSNILWFLLGVPIVLISSLLTALGASARAGHFVYVNIKSDKPGRSFKFGIPFPFGLIRGGLWLACHFGKYPKANLNLSVNHGKFNLAGDWDDTNDFINALERELREGRGITIDTNDDNERVQVYIV